MVLFKKKTNNLSVQNGLIKLKSKLGNNFFPESISVELEAKNIFGAKLFSSVNLKCKEEDSSSKLDFQNLSGKGELHLNSIDMTKLFSNSVSGTCDLHVNINSDYDDQSFLIAELQTEDLSVEFDSSEGFELLPDINVTMSGKLFQFDLFEIYQSYFYYQNSSYSLYSC